MAEKGKYSVTITMLSGERVLTEVVYPEQNYGEFVEVQTILAMSLLGAGVEQADDKGTPVNDKLKAMLAGKLSPPTKG